PPGLGNWDNSCYQNCIIQGLASLHSLKDFLSAPSMNFHRLEENSTIHSLQETLLKLTDPANGGRQLWLPGKLKSMSSWQQQDAQEYFSKIMEQMDQEARKATTINSLLLGLKDIPDSNETLPDAETASHLQSLRLHNPLEGMLAQRVGCINCGYSEGLSLIPFNCLTVALGRSHLYDIRDCLDEYTKLEPIEGVQCAKCSVQHHLEGCMRMATEKKDGSSLDTFHQAVQTRVNTLRAALNDEDFSDDTLTKKCKIPKRQWVSSTKTRQAVIARPPQCLAFHVNRSVFDEMTGTQWKNYAAVQFPLFLDLDEWGLGSKVVSKPMQEPPSETPNIIPGEEAWIMNPNVTMLPNGGDQSSSEPHWRYRLRAVITHYGRHENGHYICFRKHSGGLGSDSDGDTPTQENAEASKDSWWQLSDEDVVEVSEDNVLSQGGVFMLFYEQVPVDGISVSPDQQQDHSTAEDVHITPPLTEAD
ncbi:cysteine proteinase, partial [Eremomyces bilateralis CBS 781.70]